MHRLVLLLTVSLGLALTGALTGCSLPPAPAPGAASPVAATPPAAAPTPTAAPLAFTLLHTNDTWGYYDPCG